MAGTMLDDQYAFVSNKDIQCGDRPRIRRRDEPRDRPLEIFSGVEEVARVEGAFDLGVEMTEGGSGGYFPPRFLG